jgi:hypothetical protein
MADLGLTKAIRKGVKSSKAVRPVEPEVKPVAPEVAPITEPVVAPVEKPVVQPIPEAPVVEAEARQISKAQLGEFDLDEIHQTNFNTITTTDEVKAVIADAAERNKTRINAARREVITNDQLKGLASDLNVDTDVVRAVMEREAGGVLKPEVILAARQVLNASADRLRTLAVKVNSGQATDMDRVEFRRQMLFHDDYQSQFMGARAETGRALNAFGIPTGLDMDPSRMALLKQSVESMHGRGTDELAAMIAQLDSPQAIGKFVKEGKAAIINGTLREVYIGSLLSGIKTAIVNAAGVSFQVMNVVEKAVAARMGRLTKGGTKSGEATAMMVGALSGWRDAMRLAGKAFKAGKSLDDVSRIDAIDQRYITAKRYNIQNPALGAAVDALGVVIRAPMERIMVPTDEFMKAIAYRSELARLAYREASVQAELMGLDRAGMADLIQKFMDSPPAAAIRSGEDYARYVTFQQPLGDAAAAVQKAAGNTPGGWIIAPFIKTPVNIFKSAWAERSPLGVFSRKTREAIASGGPERDLAVARLSMGTLTVGSVALAASSGVITGGGPANPQARSLLLATGWQPYSIRYTGPDGEVRYQSYARLEPIAYVIGATADAVEILAAIGPDNEDLRSEEEQVNSMIAAVVGGVANNTMSKTFLQGFADFSEVMNDPNRYAANYLENLGGNIVPYAAFRRQFNQINDPLIREAWTLREKLEVGSGIPGWSKDAPPKLDIFGQPVERAGGEFLGPLSPFPATEEKLDPLLAEVVGVMDATGTVPISMPGKRIEGMKLTTAEYYELTSIARTEPVIGGQTFRERLDDLVGSSAYLLATPDFRVSLLKREQQLADEAGRRELENRNPVVAAKLADYRRRKSGILYGEPLLTPE